MALLKKDIKKFAIVYWFEILLIAIMSLLVIINLDWRYFAADEGYNVTMGQYILKNNWLPKIWDGKNIITTINGNDFNDSLICINLNYGAYYLTALLQLLFGKNTFLIRLPFALMGIVSAVVWYKFVHIVTNKTVSKIFLTIYSLSIPIIIYIRNANYFAPSLLFIGCMYLYYKKGAIENKTNYWIKFVVYSFIQFHINYMLFIFTIIPILFDFVINYKLRTSFVIAYMSVFISTAPFFIWMRYNFYLLNSQYRNIVPMDFVTGYYRFIEQIWHIFFYVAPIPVLLAIFFIHHLFQKLRYKNRMLDGVNIKKDPGENKKVWIFLTFALLFNFVFLSFFTLEFETRYYLAIFPLLYFIVSLIIYKIYKTDKVFSVTLLALLLFTNTLNKVPFNITSLMGLDMNSKFVRTVISSPIPHTYLPDGNQTTSSLKYESYFFKYISSFYQSFDDEIKVLVTFLNENAKDNDTINTFGTLPWTNSIQYYTNLKLVNNLRPGFGSWANDLEYYNANKYHHLVSFPDELVNWVILSDNSIDEKLLALYTDETKYKKILLPKNLPGMSNDIWLYDFQPSDSYVVLYRKIE